ncbi:MAG: oxygen-independent coproporphyrinogen III oxidase [Geminicoccaceae bacterium]|nr:oxygen-independent coproporphyrinogen III oxidase [Geminicoccaceae bacterium]MDW8342028.1 oxygen-independent coproporphyrinogen III oxidase [Geminicoccaceae bacterium]
MRPELVRLFEAARVPRYTSYPTVPHFSPAIGPAEHAAWLQAVPEDRPVSLYLHVPYCHSLCWYCGCTTAVSADPVRPRAYAALLEAELERVAALLPGRLALAHLHFGGGTPTSIGPEAFRRLLRRIGERFSILPEAEKAVEIDPRFLSAEMIEVLAETGIDRASLGVQSFEPAVQKAINRIQPIDRTLAAIEDLRAAGIRRINVDLLYGLPHQTVDGCRATVRALLPVAPDRFAIFGYAHLPALKKHQRLIRTEDLPDAPARVAQFEAMAEELEAAGYVPIGLDHFARPDDALAKAARSGALRRNFQGYTTDTAETLIGLGASAISSFADGYAQNLHELVRWRESVRAGRLPTARGIRLSARDRLERAIIEAIMCFGRVDLAEIAARFGVDGEIPIAAPDRLAELERLGVVIREGTRLRVPVEHRPLLRVVASCFDRYLEPGIARHALAV